MNLTDGLPVVAGILIVVLASGFALWPLVWRSGAERDPRPDGAAHERSTRRQALYREVLDLEFDLQTGKLSNEDYHSVTTDLLGQAALLLRADAVEESALDEMLELEIALARSAMFERPVGQKVAP